MATPSYTINKLVEVTGISRDVVERLLKDVEPYEKKGAYNRYRIKQIFDVIYDRNNGGPTYNQAKARLTKLQADEKEIQISLLTRDLLKIDDVAEVWARMVLAAKSQLLAIPYKAANELLTQDTRQGLATVLTRYIHEALNELAGEYLPEIKQDTMVESDSTMEATGTN